VTDTSNGDESVHCSEIDWARPALSHRASPTMPFPTRSAGQATRRVAISPMSQILRMMSPGAAKARHPHRRDSPQQGARAMCALVEMIRGGGGSGGDAEDTAGRDTRLYTCTSGTVKSATSGFRGILGRIVSPSYLPLTHHSTCPHVLPQALHPGHCGIECGIAVCVSVVGVFVGTANYGVSCVVSGSPTSRASGTRIARAF